MITCPDSFMHFLPMSLDLDAPRMPRHRAEPRAPRAAQPLNLRMCAANSRLAHAPQGAPLVPAVGLRGPPGHRQVLFSTSTRPFLLLDPTKYDAADLYVTPCAHTLWPHH